MTQESFVSNLENFQRTPSVSNEDPTRNRTGYQGMSSMKSTWNEGQFNDLHFEIDPLVINIKTEENI